MKFLPLFVSVLLATHAPLCAAEDYAPRIFKTSEGQSIPYRLLTPKDYDPNQKYPLVLLLHGSGERGDDNQRQLKHGAGAFAKEEARTRFPAFVVVPQCPAEARWVDVDWFSQDPHQPEKISAPLALALGAMDEVQKEFSIDPERIYVTGISMGGFGTWDLITRFPERFAAAVPICGGGDQRKIGSARAVPVWAFHGEADAVIKVERTRDMVSALAAAGAEPLATYYPATGHDSWTNAYSEPALLPWLFAQRRGQPQVSVATAAGPHSMPPTNAFPGDGPTQPGPWFRSLWKDKRSDWAASLEKGRGAVVFFGDSITQGWEASRQPFLMCRWRTAESAVIRPAACGFASPTM
jgi:poly(3-hydroxybutyrate) depolymerase